MMQFEKDTNLLPIRIQHYDDINHTISINNQIYYQSLLILPPTPLNITSKTLTPTITPIIHQHISTLTNTDLENLIPLSPQIVILGTGRQLEFPPIHLYAHLLEKKIGVEIMDTKAACRTYMLLSAEGRKVAAILLV